MTETIETLAKRLDRLEQVLETVTLQLSYLLDELVPNAPEHCKTKTAAPTSTTRADKAEGARIMNELLERMGIAEVEPIPIAEFTKVWQRISAPRITSLVVQLSQNVRNNCVPFLQPMT